MGYLEGATPDEPITFLYQLVPGLETRSYGLNVAALVFRGEFASILQRASLESRALERREAVKREHEVRLIVDLILRRDEAGLRALLGGNGDE